MVKLNSRIVVDLACETMTNINNNPAGSAC